MEIRFKNITITEKFIFNFISIAMTIPLLFQLYLKFVTKVEMNFTPLILAISMLFIWAFLSKQEKSDKGT
ncbi:hypothetical protein KFZ56_17650 [Virgibacillus sp. NKC19-3]|uniref:hypothetical protein n=1 Tax=Virgibacillus saliphilus TaxID=2831674 RepID=UPI001C9A66E6|nr:hypothetical protein [Virgibacillus sp. NKC19-3]MBY7144847.1 hypothetical protein [Virgibacillus sp. NKC19-3]